MDVHGKKIAVGDTVQWAGDFTRLNSLIPGLTTGNNNRLEQALGFQRGRLNDGFAILLLVNKPTIGGAVINGWTTQSGGKLGLPAATHAEDMKRTEVSAVPKDSRKKTWDEYKNMTDQVRAAGIAWADREAELTIWENMNVKGKERIAKIVPVIRHDKSMSPAEQYPPGDGVFQGNLVEEADWLLAAEVEKDGNWNTLKGWPPVNRAILEDTRTREAKRTMGKLLEIA